MSQEKKTILERANAIDEWITPQRREQHNKRANDRDINLQYGIVLNYVLGAAIFSLKSFFDDVLVDPRRAIRNESDIERIAMVDFLLPHMERWMNGERTAEQLAFGIHEYCKNRIMGKDLVTVSYTNPMINLMSVFDYKNYCELVDTLNKVPIGFEKEKADELRREQEEREKKDKRKKK